MRAYTYTIIALVLNGCSYGLTHPEVPLSHAEVMQNHENPISAEEQTVPIDSQHPMVRIHTNLGEITVQLDAVRAPLTVAAFLRHVDSHKYDNTSIYRIVPGYVIQAGNLDADYSIRQEDSEDQQTVPNESGNGLSNLRGTIAMARLEAPHTGTYVFYFNLGNNTKLDPHPDRWGFAVFGHVVEGMDVLDRIGAMPIGEQRIPGSTDTLSNAPLTPVTILKVNVENTPATH